MQLGKRIKLCKRSYLNFLKRNFRSLYKISICLSGIFKFLKIISKQKTNKKYSDNLDNINFYEFQITSQNNEDGIINHIINKLELNKVSFIEIGFDFYENNTLNLFKKADQGLLIDGDFEKCFILKSILNIFYFKKKIKIINSFITRENINKIIEENLDIENEEIDFLSIDVDGVDYYLFDSLNLKPKLICIEFNHWFGPEKSFTIPYNVNFQWERDFYSGASLLAITKLANTKNYHLVAIDSSATNAFFIRGDFKNKFEILDPIKSFKKPFKYTEKDYLIAENYLNKKKLIKI